MLVCVSCGQHTVSGPTPGEQGRHGKQASRGAAWKLTLRHAAGAWHTLPDGRRVPLSLVNDTAPTLAPPPQYSPRDFPFGAERAFDLRVADLLGLAMRLIYEREEVFQVRRVSCSVHAGARRQHACSPPHGVRRVSPRLSLAVFPVSATSAALAPSWCSAQLCMRRTLHQVLCCAVQKPAAPFLLGPEGVPAGHHARTGHRRRGVEACALRGAQFHSVVEPLSSGGSLARRV